MLIQPGAVPLTYRDGGRLFFAAGQLYNIGPHPDRPNEFKVKTHEYIYSLSPDEKLATKLVDWHWHPYSKPQPHLHVAGAHAAVGPLDRLHLPTSRVSFEAIVRFLIQDLGVAPQRDDWVDVLDETERRYREHRTWSDAPTD